MRVCDSDRPRSTDSAGVIHRQTPDDAQTSVAQQPCRRCHAIMLMHTCAHHRCCTSKTTHCQCHCGAHRDDKPAELGGSSASHRVMCRLHTHPAVVRAVMLSSLPMSLMGEALPRQGCSAKSSNFALQCCQPKAAPCKNAYTLLQWFPGTGCGSRSGCSRVCLFHKITCQIKHTVHNAA